MALKFEVPLFYPPFPERLFEREPKEILALNPSSESITKGLFEFNAPEMAYAEEARQVAALCQLGYEENRDRIREIESKLNSNWLLPGGRVAGAENQLEKSVEALTKQRLEKELQHLQFAQLYASWYHASMLATQYYYKTRAIIARLTDYYELSVNPPADVDTREMYARWQLVQEYHAFQKQLRRDLKAVLEEMDVWSAEIDREFIRTERELAELVGGDMPTRKSYDGLSTIFSQDAQLLGDLIDFIDDLTEGYFQEYAALTQFYDSVLSIELLHLQLNDPEYFEDLDPRKEIDHINGYGSMNSQTIWQHIHNNEFGYKALLLSDTGGHAHFGGDMLVPRRGLIARTLTYAFGYEPEIAEETEAFLLDCFIHAPSNAEWEMICWTFEYDILEIVDYLRKAVLLKPTGRFDEEAPVLGDKYKLITDGSLLPEVVLAEHPELSSSTGLWPKLAKSTLFYPAKEEKDGGDLSLFERGLEE